MKKKIFLTLLLILSFAIYSQSNLNNTTSSDNNLAENDTFRNDIIRRINQNPNYPVTPGDIYDIKFSTIDGKEQVLTSFVDNNYNLDLSFFGTVNTEGLTYSELRAEIKKIVLNAYSGALVNVEIQSPGFFTVTIQGEVNQAKIVDAWSLTTLSEVLENIMTPYSSIRNITITSPTGEVQSYDYFIFLKKADQKQNPYLRPWDVITLYPYEKKITLAGDVKRPGGYQLVKGDTLKDVINFYGGGFTKTTDKSNIIIERKLAASQEYGETLYFDSTKVDLSIIPVNDYDLITIGSKKKWPVVYFQGVIITPNNNNDKGITREPVFITQGQKISTAIKNLRGHFSVYSDLENAFIIRNSRIIPVNLEAVLHQTTGYNDIVLEDKDIINIGLKDPTSFKVLLSGEVNKNEFVSVNSFTYLSELLNGRLTPYASIRNIEITGKDNQTRNYDLFQFQRLADTNNNPIIRPGDQITVHPYEKKVVINGNVKRPGKYELKNNESLAHLLDVYGDGMTTYASKSGITIERVVTDEESTAMTLYIDLNETDAEDVPLHDGDIITVPDSLNYLPVVFFQGALSSEGNNGVSTSSKVQITISDGQKLITAINRIKSQFTLSSDLEKAFILRGDNKIEVNISRLLLEGSEEDNIILENKDVIVIPFRQYQVFVAGAVNEGGAFPFIENRTAEYYIGLARGIDESKNLFGSYSIKNVYGEKVDDDAIISPEDTIWVNRDSPFFWMDRYKSYILTTIAAATTIYTVTEIVESVQEGKVPSQIK